MAEEARKQASKERAYVNVRTGKRKVSHGGVVSFARKAKTSMTQRERCAKISFEIAQEIRAATGTQREIASKFGISQAAVSQIIRGIRWKDWTGNPWAALMPENETRKRA